MSHQARLSRYATASNELALLSDTRLGDLVGRAKVLGSGIGGVSVLLEAGGVPVFAKRIPLTDLERRPEHVMSTANLFDLPAFCQYGVGSPGFGAWRELAACTMTTNWVLAGRSAAFPLMYHWRVLPGAPPVHDGHADVEAAVAFWGGSPSVGRRLEAVASASASLVLFMEHIPLGLPGWLASRLETGVEAVTSAGVLLEQRLLAGLDVLNAGGLLHFDAHFRNILTDGRRLYFTDFGLVTSPRFELSAQESAFIARNRTHDRGYAMMCLVNWLVTNVAGVTTPPGGLPVARNDYVRRWAAGERPAGLPGPLAAVLDRHAPLAAVLNDFYWELFGESRATPYPAEAAERAIASRA
ncbi:serine/threonine-protein kinase [Nonomuraea zeae]|uniref:Serine/threonine protein phosphatase n=1 Tax=Nonomuraea zeae TaxID=1642303 RepID=A0A5S4H110_9ACTN|nr:serine/threonine-protein kinase [Nonomuraea zeae]TMR32460.1 serine/threonine protein phosphatase [Nonomuraea zeae]